MHFLPLLSRLKLLWLCLSRPQHSLTTHFFAAIIKFSKSHGIVNQATNLLTSIVGQIQSDGDFGLGKEERLQVRKAIRGGNGCLCRHGVIGSAGSAGIDSLDKLVEFLLTIPI